MSVVQGTLVEQATALSGLYSVSDVQTLSGASANAFITFSTAGSVLSSNGSEDDWIFPISLASDVNFWIRATPADTPGDAVFGGDSFNSWLQINSSNRGWHLSLASGSSATLDFATLEISLSKNSSGTQIVGSQVVSFSVSVAGGRGGGGGGPGGP